MIVDHGDRSDFCLWAQSRDGSKNCGALRTIRHAIRCVLYIAPEKYLAIRSEDRRTHSEVRVWSVRILHPSASKLHKAMASCRRHGSIAHKSSGSDRAEF